MDRAVIDQQSPDTLACEIDFAGARLALLPARAVWWADQRALLLADVHVGKPASYRAQGAPVPERVTAGDLERLSRLIDALTPERILILGDFAHDQAAWDDATMRSLLPWRQRHQHISIMLVRGNHDTRANDPPSDLRIDCVDPGHTLAGIDLRPTITPVSSSADPAPNVTAPSAARSAAPCPI